MKQRLCRKCKGDGFLTAMPWKIKHRLIRVCEVCHGDGYVLVKKKKKHKK